MTLSSLPCLSVTGGKRRLMALFSLILLFAALQARASEATPRPLEPGDETGDRLTAEAPMNFNDGSRYHLYRVELAANQVARFDVTGGLNSYLSLFAPDGTLLQHEQNGQSDTALHSYHAHLSQKIEREGSYLLAVGGNSPRSLGQYTVSVKTTELQSIAPLVPGVTIKDWLRGLDAKHTLHVDKIGQYRIRFGSDDFSAYLLVDHGSHYEAIDSGDDTDAHLDVFLRAPGDYELIIRSSDESWQEGLYTLGVEALSCC